MRAGDSPTISAVRQSVWFGAQEVALERIEQVELEVRPPNVRLALGAAFSGIVAVPSLSALAANQGTTPLMAAALGGAALLVFGGCYQLVSGTERCRITLRLVGGESLTVTTSDGARARALAEDFVRLGKRVRDVAA